MTVTEHETHVNNTFSLVLQRRHWAILSAETKQVLERTYAESFQSC
jgi:hypothetical protein